MKKLFRKRIICGDTRRSRRFQSFCIMKCVIVNRDPQKTFMVNPRNISAHGALFICDEKLPLTAILEVEIYLPPLKNFITAMAGIKRVDKIRGLDQYWVGVSFTAMDPADRKRIDSYINKVEDDPFMRRYLDRKPRVVTRKVS